MADLSLKPSFLPTRPHWWMFVPPTITATIGGASALTHTQQLHNAPLFGLRPSALTESPTALTRTQGMVMSPSQSSASHMRYRQSDSIQRLERALMAGSPPRTPPCHASLPPALLHRELPPLQRVSGHGGVASMHSLLTSPPSSSWDEDTISSATKGSWRPGRNSSGARWAPHGPPDKGLQEGVDCPKQSVSQLTMRLTQDGTLRRSGSCLRRSSSSARERAERFTETLTALAQEGSDALIAKMQCRHEMEIAEVREECRLQIAECTLQGDLARELGRIQQDVESLRDHIGLHAYTLEQGVLGEPMVPLAPSQTIAVQWSHESAPLAATRSCHSIETETPRSSDIAETVEQIKMALISACAGHERIRAAETQAAEALAAARERPLAKVQAALVHEVSGLRGRLHHHGTISASAASRACLTAAMVAWRSALLVGAERRRAQHLSCDRRQRAISMMLLEMRCMRHKVLSAWANAARSARQQGEHHEAVGHRIAELQHRLGSQSDLVFQFRIDHLKHMVLWAWLSRSAAARLEGLHRRKLIEVQVEAAAESFALQAKTKQQVLKLRKQRRSHGISAIHANLALQMHTVLSAWAQHVADKERETSHVRQLDFAAAEAAADGVALRAEFQLRTLELRRQQCALVLFGIRAQADHCRHVVLRAWAEVIAAANRTRCTVSSLSHDDQEASDQAMEVRSERRQRSAKGDSSHTGESEN